MVVYNISILNPNDGTTVDLDIGALSNNILVGEEGTLTEVLANITDALSKKAGTATATATSAGLMSAADYNRLHELKNYSLPVAANKVLGGVTINTGAGIGINATDHYLTNLGVRSIGTGGSAGTLSVNTGGSLADVKVNGWDNIAWAANYTASSFAPAGYSPAAASIKVGALAAGMTVTDSAALSGMIRNIQYTDVDPGENTSNSNNGLLICVYE